MNHLLQIYCELFKRKEFSFITDKNGESFGKQKQALEYLTDDLTEELVFGGGAGGSKSYTGWMWVTLMSLCYEETHYFVARETLKDLRLYGIQSFSEVCKFLGLKKDIHYKYNSQDSVITFNNDSKIYMIECKKKPSDTDFHGLGSSLFTSGFIEEGGEVHFDAYDTLCSRVNRWGNDRHGILGKVFITCNPAHNWIYTDFYKKHKSNELKDEQKFLPALAKDNPYVQKDYLNRLSKLKDLNKRKRLYLGIWEYDDDPTKLCDYDNIVDLFTNDHVPEGNKSISADLAMKGRDRFVAGNWSGLVCRIAIDIKDFDDPKNAAKTIELKLKELKTHNHVPNTKIVADADGLGGYLESYIKNIKEFRGGKRPFGKDGKLYGNLKDQCAFKLAELINKGKIWIKCSKEQEELIKQELSICLKQDNINNDKKRLIKKDKMKELLGRSPDYLDMLLMNMLFQLSTKIVYKFK